MGNSPRPPREPPLEFRKLQFDYAWKWFSYHADQRVKMFNFMVVVFGFFIAAIVNAVVGHQQPWFTAIISFIGAGVAAIFVGLDSRNERLLRLAEEVLTHLEKNVIFGEGREITDRLGHPAPFGIYRVNHWKMKTIVGIRGEK
jgi:putative Mn2+ efflux pump MntP